MLNRTLRAYTSKTKYDNLFDQYTDKNLYSDIFESIEEVTERLNTHNEALNTLNRVKSDSAYWGVMSDICLYEDLQESLIFIAYERLRSFDCNKMKPYLEAKSQLDKLKSNKDQTIKDLNKYKPSGYKSKIELLEDVFNE